MSQFGQVAFLSKDDFATDEFHGGEALPIRGRMLETFISKLLLLPKGHFLTFPVVYRGPIDRSGPRVVDCCPGVVLDPVDSLHWIGQLIKLVVYGHLGEDSKSDLYERHL